MKQRIVNHWGNYVINLCSFSEKKESPSFHFILPEQAGGSQSEGALAHYVPFNSPDGIALLLW